MTSTKHSTTGVLLLALLASVSSVDDNQCDNVVMRNYYKDIGCVPQGDGPCPTNFNCDAPVAETRLAKGSCRYKGRSFRTGEGIESGVACKGTCICTEDGDGFGQISCPVIDCFFPQTSEGCFPRYVPDECCPVGEICPAQNKSLATCENGGQTYYEGMSFRPEGHTCVDCTCGNGFNGTIAEPWCEPVSHNYLLNDARNINDGCVPVFISSVCYAPEWRCPKSGDQISSSSATPYSTSQPKCRFGTLELNIGDKLSGEENCSCITPPQVTCIKG